MKFLFDSKGHHIANYVNGQLHAPTSKNIGHYMENEGIFIGMRGQYLGEIVCGDKLLYNKNSPCRSVNYSSYGNYGNVGNYGNPGNHGSVGMPGGYCDVELPQ